MISEEKVYRITPRELQEVPFWGGSSDQILLRALKDKGAPVKGALYLSPDLNYKWMRVWNGSEDMVIVTPKGVMPMKPKSRMEVWKELIAASEGYQKPLAIAFGWVLVLITHPKKGAQEDDECQCD